MCTGFQLYGMGLSEVSVLLNRFQYTFQLIADEDGDDGRRCFVAAETMVIAGAGSRYTHKVCVVIHCFDHSHKKYQELNVFGRSFARVQQVDTCVG